VQGRIAPHHPSVDEQRRQDQAPVAQRVVEPARRGAGPLRGRPGERGPVRGGAVAVRRQPAGVEDVVGARGKRTQRVGRRLEVVRPRQCAVHVGGRHRLAAGHRAEGQPGEPVVRGVGRLGPCQLECLAHQAVDDDREDRAGGRRLGAVAEQVRGDPGHPLADAGQFGAVGGGGDPATQQEALPGGRGQQVAVLEYADDVAARGHHRHVP
jgi:hypothetical protein